MAAVTAVTVFGDPSFTAGQSFDVGTSTSNGVCSTLSGIRNVQNADNEIDLCPR